MVAKPDTPRASPPSVLQTERSTGSVGRRSTGDTRPRAVTDGYVQEAVAAVAATMASGPHMCVQAKKKKKKKKKRKKERKKI